MHLHVLKHGPLALVLLGAIFILTASSARPLAMPATASNSETAYIIQAATADLAAAAVEVAGGTITHELGIINGVAARLDPAALALLLTDPHLTLQADVTLSSGHSSRYYDDRETDTAGYDLYPAAAVNVNELHEERIYSPEFVCKNNRIQLRKTEDRERLQGSSITVAVVDSGLLPMASSRDWDYEDKKTGTLIAESHNRCIIYRDFVDPDGSGNSVDDNGHGTHIAATIADNRETELGEDMDDTAVGVAPQTNLVIARALDADGSGSYADVIAAIDWIVENKENYAIRVLNLSLYAPVGGYYWQDPLNQAVMRAWQAGIVVVTVAGNDGPDAGTITAPGNVPYVITVGALTSGRYTESGRDELADYSARGPTESAFVKPDLLVPATRTIAVMPLESQLADAVGSDALVSKERGSLDVGRQTWRQAYYELSGTSMAAAQVSGIVALMLQANPELSPDQVKYRLLSTARPAIDDASGEPLYTVWEQGAGLVDARAAIFAETSEAANIGLDIALDLDPDNEEHHWGYTTWDETAGEFRLVDPDSGEAVQIWQGGRRSYAGSNWLWTSGRRSYAGGRRSYAGGRRSYAGSNLTWAGSQMPWLQNNVQSFGGLGGDLVLDDGGPPRAAEQPEAETYTVWLPLVVSAGR